MQYLSIMREELAKTGLILESTISLPLAQFYGGSTKIRVDSFAPRSKFLNGARCANSNFMQWRFVSGEIILHF